MPGPDPPSDLAALRLAHVGFAASRIFYSVFVPNISSNMQRLEPALKRTGYILKPDSFSRTFCEQPFEIQRVPGPELCNISQYL